MNACSQDVDEANNGDNNNNDEEDDDESSVEDDSHNKILSSGKESGEDVSDDDDDCPAAFTNDAIGARRGQLRHVPKTFFLYTFCVCKLIFSCPVRSSALLSQFTGHEMDHVAMRFWIKRRDKLIHDYSLIGYLISPNPTIMANAYENRSTMHNDAVVHLIDKLIVNPIFVGEEKSEHLSKDIETKVLEKLACLVLSKILGIGTAERNWKQVKYIKSGLCSHTDTDRVKKQAALYGQYQQVKTCVKQTKLSSAGKLWEENDFKSSKMDEYCKEIGNRSMVQMSDWQGCLGIGKRLGKRRSLDHQAM